MSWQDRQYGNEGRTGPSWPGATQRHVPLGTLVLMALHGLACLLMLTLATEHGAEGVALIELVNLDQHPAGILLHVFASGNMLIGVFVLLALWSLGGRLEQRLGTGRLLVLYLAANAVAGLVYYTLVHWQPRWTGSPLEYPVGALAAMVLTAQMHLRHEPVRLLKRVIPVSRVYLICACLAVLLELVTHPRTAGVYLATVFLGGATALPIEIWSYWRAHRQRSARVQHATTPPPPPNDADIDDILAKISRAGVAALTDEERERLESARRAKLHRPR